MVLYFVKTTYQLLECIIHKFTVHEAEDAVLLINNGHVKNYPNYEQLEQFGFKKIIICILVLSLLLVGNCSYLYHRKNYK